LEAVAKPSGAVRAGRAAVHEGLATIGNRESSQSMGGDSPIRCMIYIVRYQGEV